MMRFESHHTTPLPAVLAPQAPLSLLVVADAGCALAAGDGDQVEAVATREDEDALAQENGLVTQPPRLLEDRRAVNRLLPG